MINARFVIINPVFAYLLMIASLPAATVITQWNFNSLPPDANPATGVTVPSVGAGTISLIGGVVAAFVSGSGSSDPAPDTDDTGYNLRNFPTQGTNSGTAGIVFAIDTTGFKNLTLTWDQRGSNTSNRFTQLQFTDNGSTWINYFATSGTVTSSGYYENTAGADNWINQRTADLSAFTTINNNPNFAVRLVSVFGPTSTSTNYVATGAGSNYNTLGTWRFDTVTLTGTPIPEPQLTSLVLLSLASLSSQRRRK